MSHNAYGHPAIRASNRVGALEVIRLNPGISRSELATRMKLTQAAISKIVGELIDMGLVVEAGLNSSVGGRPRVRLTINRDACYVVGVDLARTRIRAAVFDLAGTARHRLTVASSLVHPVDITIARLLALLEQLFEEFGHQTSKIVGIGIGAPGPLSARTGVILSPPNFVGWGNVPLRQIVQDRFQLPVWIDNDAKACALAEGWFGDGRAFEQFVYVGVGTGVGTGIVLNGDLYHGANDLAGELGHTTIEMDGPRCNCGNYGCLELYTSAVAIATAAVTALEQGESSLIRELDPRWATDLDVGTIAEAARRGDALALRLINQVVRYLGTAVVNVINLYNPEAIFLGREVMQAAGDLIVEPIRALAMERAFSVAAQNVQILPATLGEDEPVIGAACLVLDQLFSAPHQIMAPLLEIDRTAIK